MIEIQYDSNLMAKFIETCLPEFYKYLPATFENTRKCAYEIISMPGRTYRCEQLFSVMKGNKPPVTNSINDAHLGLVLKVITANKISPEIGRIVAEKGWQVSGRKH
ncbi:general transcription factor II-I repeat domain-containing protein 2 [Trichonephila clavipes]|nr:general transcription factor II-I repeat domain-containing protein 2 [Trichonephila clavipes]